MSDFFMNDKYKVIECMAQRQISVNDKYIVKLSQQEIANILGFTKTKVNIIINDLKRNGYITQVSPRGKYILTDMAVREIEKIQGKEVGE